MREIKASVKNLKHRFHFRRALVFSVAMLTIATASPAEAACVPQPIYSTRTVTQWSQVPVTSAPTVVTYQEPVWVDEVSWVNEQVVRWVSGTYQDRVPVERPIYSTIYTHTNYWDRAPWITSCAGTGCGSHGRGWVGHFTDSTRIQTGTSVTYEWVTRSYSYPVYETVRVQRTSSVVRWVNRTTTIPGETTLQWRESSVVEQYISGWTSCPQESVPEPQAPQPQAPQPQAPQPQPQAPQPQAPQPQIMQSQSISFVQPGSANITTGRITVTVSASSGLPVSVTSSTPATCSVSSTSVTLVAKGTCTLTATQAGNGTYSAAAPVTRSFQIAQPVTGPVRPS